MNLSGTIQDFPKHLESLRHRFEAPNVHHVHVTEIIPGTLQVGHAARSNLLSLHYFLAKGSLHATCPGSSDLRLGVTSGNPIGHEPQ